MYPDDVLELPISIEATVNHIKIIRRDLNSYVSDVQSLVSILVGKPGHREMVLACDRLIGVRAQLRDALGEIGRAVYQEEGE